ncbi:hypothetical protein [Hominenteromicrobium sp.]|uniref:hypothetical protein n=1 Tax=Hominenteromicrobium sp. TaxID=3073581 RepID=UPI003A8FDD4F
MDMQYVRHDTHKSNSQAQTGNDCGSAHNTDSGTHGFTTHIRHSYTEGYAYAEGYAHGFTTRIRHSHAEGYAYTEGYAYGFTTHIRHSLAHGVA